jgi:gliding motility-associated-like protein
MRRVYRYFLSFIFIALFQSAALSQFDFKVIQCETVEEVEALIDTVFLAGVNPQMIQNISFTGDPTMVGYFYNAYFTGFQVREGIIMTSGRAQSGDDSNICNSGANANTNLGLGGDPDLETLAANGQPSRDACIIEFDFKPAADTVTFNYIFASEEYHDYVDAAFNDVFGFFLSGDGIDGPFTDNAINIAEIPGTHLPVSINNVNIGVGSTTCSGKPTGCDHCEYFKDNSQADDPAFDIFVYDGFTTQLPATNPVTQCEWYHIKLAVSDIGDWLFDSGVLLEKGSFDPGNVEKQTTYTHPTVDSVLYESCQSHESVVYFNINSKRSDPYFFGFHIDTTSPNQATRGTDYNLITTTNTDTVWIEAGALYDSIRIQTYFDGEVEGVEEIRIVFNPLMCNAFGVPDTAIVLLADLPPMPDTTLFFNTACEETITIGFGDNIGGVAPYTFDWYTINEDTETVEFIPSGNNQYIIPCIIDDTCGQQQTDTCVVIVPALVADAGPDKSMCNVDSVQLEGGAPAAQQWLWESNPADPSLVGKEDSLQPWVYPSFETEYLFTVLDNCKNEDQDTVFVTLNEGVADAGDDQVICVGEMSTLTANGGTDYSWQWSANPPDPSLNGQENNQTINVTPTATTTYNVVVTNDCDFSADDNVEITVNPLPPADAGGNNEVCFGQEFQLEGGGGISYQWSSLPNDPSLYVGGQDTLPNPLVTPPTQEEYKYYLNVVGPLGCANSDSMVLQVNPVPDLDIDSDNDIICFGDDVTISAIGTADYTWSAYPPDPTLAGQENNQTITVTPLVTTTYTLTGVVTGFDCPAELARSVEVKPELQASFDTQDDIACEGETFSVLYTGNAATDATYEWDFDGATVVAGSGQGPIDLIWDTEGVKTIRLAVEEDGCRSGEELSTVTVIRTPVSGFDADVYEGCVPFTVEFTNSSGNTTDNVTYNWTFGTGDESTSMAPSYEYTEPGNYDVSLTVTNENRCAATDSRTAFISAYETPEADFDPDPIETVLEAATIDFTNGSTSGDPLTYDWDFDDGNNSDQENPSHTYTQAGNYFVKLLITTSNGCTDEIEKEVLIHPDFAVYAPNAFTPNGDGLNDYFEIKGIGIKQYLLQVYSRWGEVIYESTNLEEQWDGKFNGDFVSPGTYVFTINYTSMLDKDFTDKGTVTVMR